MKHRFVALVALLGVLFGNAAAADVQPTQKIETANQVLREFVNIPENSIPPALLGRAQGIAVFPSVLKFGFIFGGRRGNGVIAIRKPDDQWSKPAFVSLTSVSFGFQAGASSTDVILVFKTRQSIEQIADGQFNIGADAAVAAGPVGRQTSAATNLKMKAEIYSYSRSRGLFAGVSVNGGRISINQDANWLFYDKAGVSMREILEHGDDLELPKAGQRFVYTLNQYLAAAGSDGQSSQSSTAGEAATGAGRQDSAGRAQPLNRGNVSARQEGATSSTSNAGAGDGNQGARGQGQNGASGQRNSGDYGGGGY